MDRRGASILLIPLIAALALFFPSTQRTKSPGSPSRAESQPTTKSEVPLKVAEEWRGGRLALQRFFGFSDQEISFSWPNKTADPRLSATLQFLIVTLPDPVDSGLPYSYDRNLAAIEAAVQAQHYVLSDFELPWEECLPARVEGEHGVATKLKIEVLGQPAVSVSGNEGCSRRFVEEPGFLLLSGPGKDKSSPDLLLIYLIGETPTSGIQKPAFRTALNEIAIFCGWRTDESGSFPAATWPTGTCKASNELRILGPSFSGSAQSLDLSLSMWIDSLAESKSLLNVNMVSGSATAIDSPERSGDAQGRTPRPAIPSKESYWEKNRGLASPPTLPPDRNTDFYNTQSRLPGRFHFHSMENPDSTTLPLFLKYLSEQHCLGRAAIKVAFLIESGTAYGRAAAESTTCAAQPTANISKRQHGQNPNAQTDCQETLEASGGSQSSDTHLNERLQITTLPYPLHISQLRAASVKLRQSLQESTPQTTAASRVLPLDESLEDAGKRKDIETLSSATSVTSEEVMANILSTISREGDNYVGIIASDVRDVMFLAREVHEHAPKVVLFTFTADLLYLHPEINQSLRGMLIVNSYPLNNSNQLWSLPSNPDVRFQFPDDASEATFNATLALLGYDDQNRDYSLPFPSNGVPVPGTLHPPIWISVVGRDHLWPVKAQAPGDLLYTYEPSQSSLIKLLPVNRRLWWRGVYPEGSVIFISVFIVLSCFFCVPLLRRPHSSGRWARTWIGAFLAPPLFNKHRLEGELFLLVACSSLAAFLIVTITALTIPAGGIIGQAYPSSAPFAGEQLFAVIVVALLCFLFLALMPRAVFCLFRSIRSGLAKEFISVPGKLSATAWLPMISGCTVVLSLALTFVAKWIWASVMGDFRLALFTSIRYLDFANGVSALVPLLLVSVAGFLWATSSFHRLRMLEGMCHSGSFLSLIVPRFHCIHELETKVERVLHRPSLRLPGSRIVCAVATVSVSYLFLSQLVSSFENCFFYWLFAAAYLGVSLPLWLGVLRFYSVWGQTQHILQQLALTPMRDACKRFRRSFPAWPKVDLAMPAPSLAPIALSIDMLNSIVRRADLLAQTTAAKKGQFSLEVDVDGAEFEAKGKVEKEHLSDFELQALRVLASPEMVHSVDAAEAFLIAAQTADAARADDAGQWRSVLTNQCKAQEYLTGITRMVTNALELHWWKELRSAKKVPESGSSSPNQVFQLCEEFLAGRAAHFFAHVFPQMQNLIYTSVAGLLLMLFAVSSYPFQPHNQLLFFNWIVVLSFVGIALWVFVQMNRNPILSILNGTKPGQITWDREFVFRVFFYAVIPLLALLGAQFPDTVGQILSHLAPAESMH